MEGSSKSTLNYTVSVDISEVGNIVLFAHISRSKHFIHFNVLEYSIKRFLVKQKPDTNYGMSNEIRPVYDIYSK